MLASLVFSCLGNSVDMEGDMPDEVTAELEARFELEGHEAIVLKDTLSGTSFSGSRGPQNLYSQLGTIVNLLNQNPYKPIRIKSIDCTTRIVPGRRSADVEAIEPVSDTYAPGEKVQVSIFYRPYRGTRQRLSLSIKLPDDMPEGTYSVMVCDDLANARMELRENPVLGNPQSVESILEAVKMQTSAKRTNVVLRVPINAVGVALAGKPLPNLPPGMVQILGEARRTGAQTLGGALVSRQATEWVVQGAESAHFTVARNKRVADRP